MGDQPFGSSRALGLLEAALEQAGVLADGAQLLRFGSNAIYRLGQVPVVVRVGRGAEVVAIAERELAVARWLAEEGYPGARVWEGAEQPVLVEGHPVTFWVAVEGSEGRPSFGDLGRLLRRLHELAAPPFELPAFSPFRKMRDRIGRAEDVNERDRRFLAERCERIEEAFATLKPALRAGPIHGDAHRGNVLCENGGPVLLDFEEFAVGPREWDLIPTAMSMFRFGVTREEYQQFVDAYGFDVLSWSGADLLMNLREMTMTTWLMQNVGEGHGVAREFQDRVESMRTGERDRAWRAF